MATAAPVYEGREMSIGRVFERAFGAIRVNPVVILGLGLVVGALPNLILNYAVSDFATPTPGSFAGMFGLMFATWLISIIVSAIVQGSLTQATVVASEGRKATFGESLAAGFRVALPLVGLAIVSGIGVMIGTILLIVPGIILILMWAVAAPALVVEREGVFAALSRSADLTSGARWKILGMFLVLIVGYLLLSYVVGLVGFAAYSPTKAAGLAMSSAIGSIVLGTVYNAASGTLWPALYVELREWKEGTSAEKLAEVFA
jgi:uncharacterized membrane protein